MMTPNQIKNFSLAQNKQGLCRAADFENFRQRVYNAYDDLFSSYNELRSRFNSLSELVNEYNAGKNSIATAIINAQTYANKTMADADEKAKTIVSQATEEAETIAKNLKSEADAYYSENKAKGDKYLAESKAAYEKIMDDVREKAEKYIERTNADATVIIEKANEKASEIVSRAYVDAKKARETCDDIINQANKALPKLQYNVQGFKKQIEEAIAALEKTLQSIDVPENIDTSFLNDENSDSANDEKQKVEAENRAEFTYEIKETEGGAAKEDIHPDFKFKTFMDVNSSSTVTPVNETQPEIQFDLNSSSAAAQAEEKSVDSFAEPETSPEADEQKETDDNDSALSGTDYIFDRFSAFSDLFSSSDNDDSSSDFDFSFDSED